MRFGLRRDAHWVKENNWKEAMQMIELRAGAMRAALRPDLGASVAGLWCGDTAVLRSLEASALQAPRQSGNFALVPYSNRVGGCTFNWHGTTHRTTPNFEGSVHSVHGSAWTQAWKVVKHDAHSAELSFAQSPNDHWPFAFEVTQRFVLSELGLRQELMVVNTDTRSQPMGLGWHPYFPKRARSRIHVDCAHQWMSDPATQLPTHSVASHGVDADVRHLDLDHAFDGWSGQATIRDEKLAITLTSSLRHAVIFTPPLREHFCVEPVSHVSNAVNMAAWAQHGIVDLRPGQSMSAWMQIDAVLTHA
jgi:aldose 1-epimerase